MPVSGALKEGEEPGEIFPPDPTRRERETTYGGPTYIPGGEGDQGIAYVPRGIRRRSDRSTLAREEGSQGTNST